MVFGNTSSDTNFFDVTLAFCLSFLAIVLVFLIFTLVGFNTCGRAGCCYTASNSCCTGGYARCLRILIRADRLPNLVDRDQENSGYIETATEISSMGVDRGLRDFEQDSVWGVHKLLHIVSPPPKFEPTAAKSLNFKNSTRRAGHELGSGRPEWNGLLTASNPSDWEYSEPSTRQQQGLRLFGVLCTIYE
jgi:hypothetical protein